MNNSVFSVGYARRMITPENGTGLGGYGNSMSRTSIGKMIEDDDLYVTSIAMTNADGETVIIITVDLVRMPFDIFTSIRQDIVASTGVIEKNILISATHSHSTPDVGTKLDPIVKWVELFKKETVAAAVDSLADRKPARVFAGIREVKNLNFVRRYMKDGKFLGTNRKGGDAHESASDNKLQLMKFVREGASDIVIINWGAHPDHSKDIGGASGTPEFHRGVSADYIYSLRKTVEQKAGVKFAFFESAAGNLNPRSLIPGEDERVNIRAEKDGVKRYIAYGRELADEVLALLDTKLTELSPGKMGGTDCILEAKTPGGVTPGSELYNQAYAVAAVIFAKRTIEQPTKESIAAAELLINDYELGDTENLMKIAEDESHPLNTPARCAKMLKFGGKMDYVNEMSRNCAGKMCTLFKFSSGPYGSNGILRRAENAGEPVNLPLYAVSCGDFAFTGTPGEPFDTNAVDVKNASPFKMTFYCEHSGGSFGYYPSKLAWTHGGYELNTTGVEEGTAERISEKLIGLLNELKSEQQ